MINKHLRNLSKIEFVVTDACTGHCKHCSEGGHNTCSERIDPQIAADSVRIVSSIYNINTVMTFGGEPLLHPDAVYAIMNAAKELNVPKRQLITNGYFTNNVDKIREVVRKLALCGVNDILLSVDAFHQETIPIEIVQIFAAEVKGLAIPIRLSPAWLSGAFADNQYNIKTREILSLFNDIDIPVSAGNVVFPAGNALKYLSEYFDNNAPENPYIEDPDDVHCLSFAANGDVLDGNIYNQEIMNIINNYSP